MMLRNDDELHQIPDVHKLHQTELQYCDHESVQSAVASLALSIPFRWIMRCIHYNHACTVIDCIFDLIPVHRKPGYSRAICTGLAPISFTLGA